MLGTILGTEVIMPGEKLLSETACKSAKWKVLKGQVENPRSSNVTLWLFIASYRIIRKALDNLFLSTKK